MCVLYGLVSSLMVLLLSAPKIMRMELVIMDIEYMFKTYEAFPYVVYSDPLLHEVAAR